MSQLNIYPASKEKRDFALELIKVDFAVAGGGLSGVCAALTAARHGLSVALIQDRPVLGGNASSEVRLWALGATSHMGNNNRWSREGGVIDEILVENLYRNREGNPVIFDTVLLDLVISEPRIRLLLNTTVTSLSKSDGRIESLRAFNSQNGTEYMIESGLFCDATGDGTVAYLAGAAYRVGAEDSEEFREGFSPSESYGRMLGHTISFYSKKTDKPVRFFPPSFALKDITRIPKYEQISSDRFGCNYWWFEYGGELDTVASNEDIKMELWKVVYGAWDYIKNSGRFPEAENMTLEWVGAIPGKRESRRFVGHYMLTQSDIVSQRDFDDAVAYGGWAIDLHPAAGVYSELPSCNQYHSKGIYPIPYRCYVSRDVENLFYAGRIISSSHVAFGSTRVMTTCALGAQAVGMAASMCVESGRIPSDLFEPSLMKELQSRLNYEGQSIPKLPLDNRNNLLASASIKASSELILNNIPKTDRMMKLTYSVSQILPLKKNTEYSFSLVMESEKETSVDVQLAVCSRLGSYTPDRILQTRNISLAVGMQKVDVSFDAMLDVDQYAFFIIRSNPDVSVAISDFRCTGVLSAFNKFNYAVNNLGRQMPPEGSGFDSFEFWCPDRRPAGENLAMTVSPSLKCFGAENLTNGFIRPYLSPDAWVSALEDETPVLEMNWDEAVEISSVRLFLDTDYDHPMETVQYGHPENEIPFCVSEIRVYDKSGSLLSEVRDNHKTIVDLMFTQSMKTDYLKFEFVRKNPDIPVSVFEIHVKH